MNFLNEKSAKAQEDRRCEKQRQMEDLLAVLAMPEGRSFLVRQLRRSGLHEMCVLSETSMAMRNSALLLLEEIKTAHPGYAREILLRTFDLGEI